MALRAERIKVNLVGKGATPLVVLAAIAAAFSTPSHSKEYQQPPSGGLTSSDWLRSDRDAYMNASKAAASTSALHQVLSGMSPPGRRFTDAVRVATVNENPETFNSISERNAYYDYVGFLLETSLASPRLNGVRFFHAAFLVTSQLGLGAVETIDKLDQLLPTKCCSPLSDDTRKLLTKINATLFAKNMSIVRKLLFEWHEPRDPRLPKPTTAISPWDFDLAMVEFEQSNVEALLEKEKPTAAVRAELKNMEQAGAFRVMPILAVNSSIQTYLKAANIVHPDFNDKSQRIAIGKAWVTLLHKNDQPTPRGVSDYLASLARHT